LSWKQALLGATIGFVTCISIALLCQFFLKKECLGGGDIKLITGLGAFLGITGIFITLFAASVIAIVTLIIIRYDLKKEFPFGPFLILGAILYQFLGNAIINYYLSLWKF
jgi:leader peptidase (prepilin peptidase)/N-methyltransferase